MSAQLEFEGGGILKPEYIIIHCSATKDSGTVSWQAIRRYHVDSKGWRGIGYHFGIERVNEEHYEILLGRLPDETGAHCSAKGMNHKSIGICCVGDFDKEVVPWHQWEACLRLTRWLMKLYNVPEENVIGHREVDSGKSCPGKHFDMYRFREQLL